MSSSQLPSHLSPGRHNLAIRARRSAIAVALAAGIATATAASLTSAGPTRDVTSQMSSAITMPAPHVGATSVSFVRRIRTLEAAGYLDHTCAVNGELMFNPRLHRYVMVRS